MFSRESFSNFFSSIASYCKASWHSLFSSDDDLPPDNERDSHSPSPSEQNVTEIIENGILPSYCASDDLDDKNYTTLSKHMKKYSVSYDGNDDENEKTPPPPSNYVDMAAKFNLSRKNSIDPTTCLTKKKPWYSPLCCIFSIFRCGRTADDNESEESYEENPRHYNYNDYSSSNK